jgi:acetolactate synthase I/II/III large subunit
MSDIKTKRVKGSEAVMLSLLEEKVDTIFGYPGGQIMPVYDALYDYKDRLKHILNRHEQGAIHSAQGYARATGKVGVCFTTSGPGATNIVTGLADALMDSTPIVCICGQVPTNLLGTNAFQETDVIGISMPVTKWNYQISSPDEVADAIAKAFYIAASGRPGPVLLDLTRSAQIGETDFHYKKCKSIRSYIPKPPIEESKILEACLMINEAKKPFALIGHGVLLGNAWDELKEFLEKTGIPFGWTILGSTAMPVDHPLNMGMLGMHGNYAANINTNECDVMIALGMRFDDRVTGLLSAYAKQAKIIHVDIDNAEINKNVPIHVPVLGDLKDVLPMLTKHVKQKTYPEWLSSFKKLRDVEEEKVIKKDLHPTKPGITMGEVIRMINEKTKGEAIYVTDVGQQQMFVSRYAHYKHPRHFITSGGLGTMGFGLPSAFGAKVACPDKEVVLFVGDGGIQMTIQELATMIQYEVAVKIVLLNNHYLGMVRQWQELFWNNRYSETPMYNPDFHKIALAYGLGSSKVDKREQLDVAIKEMLASKKAYLIEVTVEKEDNVFPMVAPGAAINNVLLG